jgi:hypothetical protein
VLVVRSTIGPDITGSVTATAEPSEEGEHGGEDIDNKDGSGELERWPGEGVLDTGDDWER